MIKLTIFFTAFVLSASVNSTPERTPWDKLNEIGEAQLSVAIWDIYRVSLFVEGNQYHPQKPFALKLTYLRPIDKKRLVKETHKQWKKMNLGEPSKQEFWLKRLDELWQDVNVNDELTLYVDQNQHAQFYFNGQLLGHILDPEFSHSFSSIWLSENTTRPSLRQRLLGER